MKAHVLGAYGTCVWLACAAWTAQAVTGVWTHVSGGYWADPANWQDGVVPTAAGMTDGSGDVADFTALGAGQAVTLTNYTAAGALLFSNTADTVWTVTGGTNSMGFANSPFFPVARFGEIRVEGGALNFAVPVASAGFGVAKTGSGTLVVSATNTYAGNTWLKEGTLVLSNGALPSASSLIFNAPAATLRLDGDGSVGGLASAVWPSPSAALNGHAVRVGGAEKHAEWNGRLTGDGTLTLVRGEVQTLVVTQSYAGVTRLENGSLRLGRRAEGRTVAWWRFDDENDIGKDSGSGTLGNDLVKVGTPTRWYVSDPVRGGVLSLDNNAYLTGQGANKDIAALPTNNAPFTVAFWIKPDAGVTNTAILYGWGTFDSAGRGGGLRLNLDSPSEPLKFADWLSNPTVPYGGDLKDGAWHHVAVVYTGAQFQFRVDGLLKREFTETSALSVTAGNFRIGSGWLGAYYTGLIDDFMIADWAMNSAELYAVRSLGQEPDTTVYAVDDLLPATAKIEVGYSGVLYLSGDQTVATLGGLGAAGGIMLTNGGTLTVNGIGSATSTVFRSAISGDGAFVKRGADYRLTLDGRNSYTGATDVLEGVLALTPQMVPGLQAYYRFDDAGNLGKDSSGHGYDLVASNTPTYVASGRYGGAAGFAVADQDLLMAGSFPATLPTGDASYTFAVWCNPSAGNTKGMPLYWGSPVVGALNAALFRFDSATSLLFSNFGNNQTVSSGFDLFTDTLSNGWHHIASTFDSSNGIRRVYIDGVLKWTDPTSRTLAIATGLLQLGGAPYSSANFYDGLLDEVMIFDRALAGQEIQAVMTGRKAVQMNLNPTPFAGRIACYRFDDASNPGKDSGPYGYDLALSSTSSVKVAANGRFGGALDLSTSYGYLAWTNSVFPEMMPTGDHAVTISAWINPKTGADTEGAVVCWGTPSTSKGCHLLRLKGGARTGLSYSDGFYPSLESEAVDGLDYGSGQEGWHHVAAVYAPGARSLYVDGVLVNTDNRSGLVVTPNSFYIGRKDTAGRWFQGLIDEVDIYDRALSIVEILSVIRQRSDILPTHTVLNVAFGAKVDLDNVAQRVTALTGHGEVELALGVLTVAEKACRFDGKLMGEGNLVVRDGAELTLTGTNTFSGSVTVSNATLRVDGAATGGVDVAVQAGGVLGGSGTVAGTVTFENGAAIAAGAPSATLTVSGTVTLGSAGTVAVTLPEGFEGGPVGLISATTLSAPSGLSGWTVSGADASWKTVLKQSGGTLTLNVFRRGTLISVL